MSISLSTPGLSFSLTPDSKLQTQALPTSTTGGSSETTYDATLNSLANDIGAFANKGDFQDAASLVKALEKAMGLPDTTGSNTNPTPSPSNAAAVPGQSNSATLGQDQQFLSQLLQSGNADPNLVSAMEQKVAGELNPGGTQAAGGAQTSSGLPGISQGPNIYSQIRLMEEQTMMHIMASFNSNTASAV